MSFLSSSSNSAQDLLAALEAELGEKTLFRTTGRLLAAEGLGTVPLDSWGLVALTPTRLYFRHYAQPHPLFGLKDQEQVFVVPRSTFERCDLRPLPWWRKLFSGTPEHLALSGPGVQLALETGEPIQKFAAAWAGPVA